MSASPDWMMIALVGLGVVAVVAAIVYLTSKH
jgi:energy-converting hydrogenase Eha subunit C